MRSFHEKSRASYNEMADHYDDTPEGRFTLEFKHKLLDEISAGRGMHALDVACGNGTLLQMMQDRFGIIGYGADIADKMIEQARINHPRMTFEVAGCEKMPYDDQAFDLMTVCAAYHHFPDIKAFAAEATRLLKPKGCLYIAELCYSKPLQTAFNLFLPLSRAGDVRLYSPQEIMRTWKKFGFDPVKTAVSGHIQIVALQKSK